MHETWDLILVSLLLLVVQLLLYMYIHVPYGACILKAWQLTREYLHLTFNQEWLQVYSDSKSCWLRLTLSPFCDTKWTESTVGLGGEPPQVHRMNLLTVILLATMVCWMVAGTRDAQPALKSATSSNIAATIFELVAFLRAGCDLMVQSSFMIPSWSCHTVFVLFVVVLLRVNVSCVCIPYPVGVFRDVRIQGYHRDVHCILLYDKNMT